MRVAGHLRPDRAEQVQGLVDRMAAQVQQGATAGERQALRLRWLLHPGLEAPHLPELAGGDDVLHGPEVRGPPPVLVDAQQDTGPLGVSTVMRRRCG